MSLACQTKRRSLLFFSALSDKYFSKARYSSADALVFDLEDSVSTGAKDCARRALLRNFPRDYMGDKELMVRVNDSRSPWYRDDLDVLKVVRPHAVFTAKTEGADELRELDEYLSSYDCGHTDLVVAIENPKGYWSAREILGSSDRVKAAVLGVEDLVGDFGIERGKLWENSMMMHMLNELAIVCHHYGLQFIGPATRGYKERHIEEIEKECECLKGLGASGKLVIHPNQLDVVNSKFDIAGKISEAQKILGVFDEAKGDGFAAVGLDGEMFDTPSIRGANKILEYASRHGFLDS